MPLQPTRPGQPGRILRTRTPCGRIIQTWILLVRHPGMLRPVPSTAVRTIARRNAQAVAARLGLKFVSRRAVVLGEPDCPYEIRWNAPDFWFGINISDTSFIVRGNHKQRFATEARFLASLNSAYPTMATTMRLESLSRQLGVSVFIA